MKACTVIELSVFSQKNGGGNLCGLVLNGAELTSQEMQTIASLAGYSETVFIVESKVADIGLRFFMPNQETPLCGHGTIGAISYLSSQLEAERQHWHIETQAGILEATFNKQAQTVTMSQSPAMFKPYQEDIAELCQVLGIQPQDLDPTLPVVYGSTGVWTLIVPVKKLASLAKMLPQTQEFPKVLQGRKDISIHPFTKGETSDYVARHFSSYASGIIEDPVTGTASGVMAAYLLVYGDDPKVQRGINIEQGVALKELGKVTAQANYLNRQIDVKVKGETTYKRKFNLSFY